MPSFFVEGIPKPQPRPKACIRGRHAGVYDPGTADEWKAKVRKAWRDSGLEKFVGPLKVSYHFEMPRPKSHFKKGVLRPGAPYWHIIRPDMDNVIKSTQDALTDAGAWDGDEQVCAGDPKKRYCGISGRTGCLITIEQLTL